MTIQMICEMKNPCTRAIINFFLVLGYWYAIDQYAKVISLPRKMILKGKLSSLWR